MIKRQQKDYLSEIGKSTLTVRIRVMYGLFVSFFVQFLDGVLLTSSTPFRAIHRGNSEHSSVLS
jgi:hypothetical protein